MTIHPRFTIARLAGFSAVALALTLAGGSLADSITVNNITYPDVRISGAKDGDIVFTVGLSSNEIRKPIASVSKITLTEEPSFMAAENAYAAKEWDKACEAYDKIFRTTQKDWLKDWVSLRLLDSANKGGRVDVAVKTYIAMAEKSPESLRGIKLTMPKPDSAYLTEGIKLVNSAIAATKKDASKQSLLNLLVELNKAKGDIKAATEALNKTVEIKSGDPGSPGAARAAVELKLKAIALDLSSKQYDKVIAAVEKDAAVFSEPADQAEALYCLAEAKAGKAAASKDADVWKEVSLAYMRVVANCPGSPSRVADALMKTAAIHETRLNEPETALRIYQQVAADYKGQESARQADGQMQRLKAKSRN